MSTTHVTIYKWFGRIGNNLIQIVHALSYAQKHKIDYIPLPKYMKPGDWRNTSAQRKLMLTYQL